MKKIVGILMLAIAGLLFFASCDKEEVEEKHGGLYKTVENVDITLFEDLEYHSNAEMSWLIEDGKKKKLLIRLHEMIGVCHDIPKFIYDLPISDEGVKVIVSGNAFHSLQEYSYIPEDISVEFYITKMTVVKE